MKKLRHVDLCSGIGGFSLGLEATGGFRTVAFAEIDAYCGAVLKKHWPKVKNYGDIGNVRGIGCEIVTAGFPCQPFSTAGQRRGKDDDRHIWPAVRDVVASLRPAWFIGENVPGIIDMELDDCCADLEDLGYEVQPFVVPACAVDARHRRDRVWIIAHAVPARQRRESREGEVEADVADTNEPGLEGRKGAGVQEHASKYTRSSNPFVANANIHRRKWRSGDEQMGRQRFAKETPFYGFAGGAKWKPESGIRRISDGIPNRVHRLKGLGNAIVPQIAEAWGRFILETERLMANGRD